MEEKKGPHSSHRFMWDQSTWEQMSFTLPSSLTNKGQSFRTFVSFLDMKSFCSSGISFCEDQRKKNTHRGSQQSFKFLTVQIKNRSILQKVLLTEDIIGSMMPATSVCFSRSRGMPSSMAAAARRRTLGAECTTSGMISFAHRTTPSRMWVGTCSSNLWRSGRMWTDACEI